MKKMLVKWLSSLLIAALLLSPAAMMEEDADAENVDAQAVTAQTEAGGEEPSDEAPVLETVDADVPEDVDIPLGEGDDAALYEAKETEASLDDMAEDEAAPEDAAVEEAPDEAAKRMEAAGEIPIDAAHFPDAGFMGFVAQTYDTDHNGGLSDAERNAVKILNLEGERTAYGNAEEQYVNPRCSAQSLQGIEYFPEITDLFCSGIGLTGTLDLSKNTKLTRIFCSQNSINSLILGNQPNLTLLVCHTNQLTSLDLSGCSKLVRVYCWKNSIGNIFVGKKLNGKAVKPVGYFNIVNLNFKFTKSKKAAHSEYDIKRTLIFCDKSAKIAGKQYIPIPGVEQVSVAKKSAKLKVTVGSTFQINPGATAGAKFKSSKKKVATVDANGIVTAKAKGKTRITFMVGKKKRVLTLTVVNP